MRVFGVLLMLSALALTLSQAPDRPVQTLVARWAPPPSDFIELHGMVVHIRDVGPRADPLPVVLLHGAASSLHTWEGWVRALKGQRRVVTFDLPGFGLTGPWAGTYAKEDYSGDAYARFVIDLLAALKIDRAVLGGNSFGGEVAWRTAFLAPQRVAGLILVDATGEPYTSRSVPLGFLMARVPLLNPISEWVLPRSLVAQGLAEVYGDPARVTEDLVDRYFELTLREGNRRALALLLQQERRGADASRIATLELPTLIVWGARDRLIPPETGQRFARQIAGSRLVVIEGLGHLPQEEDAARSVQPVLEFLGLKVPAP